MDLDVIARNVVEPGSEGIAKIVDTFGAAYLNLDGTLDRKRLAALVFNDKAELAKLDGLMGPLLWAEVERQRDSMDAELAFVDGALIIEKGMHKQLHGIVLVTAPFSVRVTRAMERDGATVEEVKARVQSQMDDHEKRRYADFVIDNDGTLHELQERVMTVLEQLRESL
jgi:dephospho-CoA kinase